MNYELETHSHGDEERKENMRKEMWWWWLKLEGENGEKNWLL